MVRQRWIGQCCFAGLRMYQHGIQLHSALFAFSLCSGLEAPLVAEGAGQVLEAAGQQQAQQERLAALMLRRAQRGQSGSRDGSPELDGQLADAAEDAADAAFEGGVSDADAAARLDAPDGAGQGLHCLLCGGKSHGKAGGFKACPVFKMALAVPKPPQGVPHAIEGHCSVYKQELQPTFCLYCAGRCPGCLRCVRLPNRACRPSHCPSSSQSALAVPSWSCPAASCAWPLGARSAGLPGLPSVGAAGRLLLCVLRPQVKQLVRPSAVAQFAACPRTAWQSQSDRLVPLSTPATLAQAEWRQALERPLVRRAPWLDDVLPATRELMQAVQVCLCCALLCCAALCCIALRWTAPH